MLFILPFDRCYMILPGYIQRVYIFASFTGYEDDSNLHVQGSKFGGKMDI